MQRQDIGYKVRPNCFISWCMILSVCAFQVLMPQIKNPLEASGRQQVFSLVTLKSDDLGFGTSIYPFRSKQNIAWLLSEARALGLTELRVEYSRDRVERSAVDTIYIPSQYIEKAQDIVDSLRHSGVRIILLLDGYRKNEKGAIVDWPRNADSTIDGAASAKGMANYAHWVVNTTGDFVDTYELWNEAFNNLGDPILRKGFGPGGSRINADNYSAMFLPVVDTIKSISPSSKVTVEGNYWNLDRSVGGSPGFQELLGKTDYCVIHPYGYSLNMYQPGGDVYDAMNYYPRYNPAVKFWWTEYGVSPKNVGLDTNTFTDTTTQSKALIRATLLHLLGGVRHLDFFCMYYPSIPGYSLIYDDSNSVHIRKPAWYVFQKFLTAITPGQASLPDTLIRTHALPDSIRDLAIATKNGFTYLIWQETPVDQFASSPPLRNVTVSLGVSDIRQLKLDKVLDPITGKDISNVTAIRSAPNQLTLTLAVADYPLICWFKLDSTATVIEETPLVPPQFHLDQTYPNPFNPTTTIRFSLPHREQVTLKVFDVLGREVVTLVNGELNSGEHSIVYDAKSAAGGLPSGVYFYRLTTPALSQTRAMELLR